MAEEANGKPATTTNGANNQQQQQRPPIDLLQAMVENDHRQNQRLSKKFSLDYSSDQAGNDGNESLPERRHLDGPSKVTRIRFIVCTLGIISISMSQMSRTVLNQSITQMVDPSMKAKANADDDRSSPLDGSCPWPDDDEQLTTISPLMDAEQNLNELPDLEDENSVLTTPRPVLVAPQNQSSPQPGSNSSAQNDPVDLFKWDMKQQNTLLGGFYYSYFVFMVLGGRMAEIYGAKYVLLLAVAGSALINLATPWLARTSFGLLLGSRICMGAIQAGVMPAMYALISKWLTMSEASIYTPLIKMNLRLGMALGSMVPGFVASWPHVFYFTGLLSAVWSLLWLCLATSTPAENKWVSQGEVKHINRKKRQPAREDETKATTKSTPWLKIITAPSVVGLVIVKLTFNYSIDFLAIELPSYLKYVHHASKGKISFITTFMFSIQVVLIVFVGWLAKVLVQRRPFGLSKTAIRKLFQLTASVGMALTMFAITFNDCNLTYVAVLLQLTSFLSMFTAGGETMLPYDLSEEYPATIMAIANSVANLSAITTTTLAGVILGDQGGSYHRWNILIYLIVGANLLGGSAFLLLVKAEPIDFEGKKKKTRQSSHVEQNSKSAENNDATAAAQYDIEMQTESQFKTRVQDRDSSKQLK